jgi:uncharacterized repeat protein (TIGR03803 family)
MTSQGGGVKGIIFKTDSSGNNFSVEYIFENFEQNPKGTLIKANNGKYYGMSDNGGLYGLGTIFEYDNGTDSVKILHHFDGAATGAHPKGSLIQASNNKLYGMTREGGTVGVGWGVIFEYDLESATYTKLHDFDDGPTGVFPIGSLVQASNGKFYGTASGGGYGAGTIFELDLSSSRTTVNKLYNFNPTTYGANPLGNLTEAITGKLYGLASSGGVAGYQNNGTLYEWDISTQNYRMVHDFDGNIGNATGSSPRGSLMQASNGRLYGTTYVGGIYNSGVIFEYDITNDTVIKVHDFGYDPDCNGPMYNNLIEGSNDMLFGMTTNGGAIGYGGLFKFNCSSGTFTKLHDFTGSLNGREPWGSLIESAPGKYLGMTNWGGTAGKGMIFEYDTTDRATFTVKHSFDAYSGGQIPYGSLCAASNGKFYGLTKEGGINNLGTLFEYDPFTGKYRKWHDFDGTATGAYPQGSLIEAVNGKFYSCTREGGAAWQGTLFEFDPTTGVVTKKYDFGYSPAPGLPIGSLVEASNGNLYGLSSFGGAHNNYGTLYEYNISTNTLAVKHDFDNFTNVDGRAPEGSLIETNTDTLYGMTTWGGTTDHGTIFEYIISTNTLTKKHDFNNIPEGREPKGSLILASNGKLYGLTSGGGVSGAGRGTLFDYDIQSGILTVKHDFYIESDGVFPHGSLIESTNGKFYGMTSSGGTAGFHDKGVLFEYDTTTSAYTKKLDFDGTNGQKPQYTQLIKIFVHADWTGAVSTDWHNPANWAQNDVPTVYTEVVIPDVSSGSNRYPVISSDVHVRDLTIEPGASIDVQNNADIQVGMEED